MKSSQIFIFAKFDDALNRSKRAQTLRSISASFLYPSFYNFELPYKRTTNLAAVDEIKKDNADLHNLMSFVKEAKGFFIFYTDLLLPFCVANRMVYLNGVKVTLVKEIKAVCTGIKQHLSFASDDFVV